MRFKVGDLAGHCSLLINASGDRRVSGFIVPLDRTDSEDVPLDFTMLS